MNVKLCSRKLSSPHYKLLYLEVPSVSLRTFLYQGHIHSHQHRFVSRNIPGLLESVCKLGTDCCEENGPCWMY